MWHTLSFTFLVGILLSPTLRTFRAGPVKKSPCTWHLLPRCKHAWQLPLMVMESSGCFCLDSFCAASMWTTRSKVSNPMELDLLSCTTSTTFLALNPEFEGCPQASKDNLGSSWSPIFPTFSYICMQQGNPQGCKNQNSLIEIEIRTIGWNMSV